jgi:hypothetical protein
MAPASIANLSDHAFDGLLDRSSLSQAGLARKKTLSKDKLTAARLAYLFKTRIKSSNLPHRENRDTDPVSKAGG